jgi:hypothetical protein
MTARHPHLQPLLLALALAAPGACRPAPPSDRADAGAPGGPAHRAAWACDDAALAPRSPAAGALFAEATARVLPGVDTVGFGRPVVVDLDGDGRDDLVLTPAHDGRHPVPPDDMDKLVLRARGDGTFEDFTEESGLDVAKVGLLVFGDVDGDGDQDAFAGTIEGKGKELVGIWRNDGRGRFTFAGPSGIEVATLPCGPRTCSQVMIAATFADLDADGHLDLHVGAWFWSDGETATRYEPPGRDALYRGRGDGTFEVATAGLGDQLNPRSGVRGQFGRATMGISPGDFDDDGRVDLFVANYGAGRPVGPDPARPLCQPPRYWDWNLLLRNEGGLRFTDVGEARGVAATVRGPRTEEEPPLRLGEECPEAVRGDYPGPIGGNSFTSQFGDFDGDGDLDLLVGSIAHPDYLQSDPTTLFVNQGPPGHAFTEEARARGLVWREDEKHVYFADLDLDGRLDIVTTGFRDPRENELRVFVQRPGGTFELLAPGESGVDDRAQEGAVLLDFDADGDLDLWLAHDTGPLRVFENRSTARRLEVRLAGAAPRDATGARLLVEAAGTRQRRDVVSGNGHYNPQPSRGQYFGLGDAGCVDRLELRWPGGARQVLGPLRADLALGVEQGGAVTVLGERRPRP